MAGNRVAENKKAKSLGAIELALANHQLEDGLDKIEFETDVETMEQEDETLYNFMKSRNNLKNSNKVFFKINNRPILGSNGEKLKGDKIPLFTGAAIDLESMNAIGEKKFLKPPRAVGNGGIFVIIPQSFNRGLVLPFDKIELKENYIDGDIYLNDKTGFHGNHIRLTAEKMHVTIDKVEFINPKLVYKTKDDESVVPVSENVYIDESGFSPKLLTKALRIEAPNKQEPIEEISTETQTTEEISEVSETVDELTENNQPDRIIFQVGRGRFRSKQRRIPFDFYDGFSIQWKDGQLIAVVKLGNKEVEININKTEFEHKYTTSDSITVELEDKIGIVKGILSLFGVKDVENGENGICYRDLEFSEEGIFFGSFRGTQIETKIDDNWELKIGNDIGGSFSNKFFEDKKDDEGSYFELAKTVLSYFGIISDGNNDEEKEGEEKAKEGNNNFKYSVAFFTFPIIPGLLSVDAKFNAGAKMGYKVSGSVNNVVGALKNQQAETFGFDLRGAITGNAYAGFDVGLTAGSTNIMNVSANIGAKIALTGGDNDSVFSIGVHTEFEKGRKGMPHFKKAEFDALLELYLKAVLDGSLKAQILGWEKNLYTYTFKEFEIAMMEAQIKATKEANKSWTEDASLSYKTLSGRVKNTLKTGDKLEKMFEKQEVSYGKTTFDASQSSFEYAKKILLAYHDKSKPMFIDTKNSNSGFLNMNMAIKELQHRFYFQLRKNEETIGTQIAELQKLKTNKTYNITGKEIESEIIRHTNNISAISKALEESKSPANTQTNSTNQSTDSKSKQMTSSEKIMEAYIASGGNKSGFLSYLKDKSKKEAVTVEALIRYEESRRTELVKKSTDRIKQMQAYAQSIGITEYDKSKGSLLFNKYKSIGGKAIRPSEFSTIETLRKYEEERIAQKHTSKINRDGKKYRSHTERLDKLAIRFPDIVQNGSDTPNIEFYEYYTKNLKAKKFSNNLDIYSNRERLLAYERKVLKDKLEGNYTGMFSLIRRDKIRELSKLTSRTEEQEKFLNQLILGGKRTMESDEKAYYMIAQKDDFIAALIEQQKANALKLFISNKIKENKGSKKWLFEMIKNNISINDIITYEQNRVRILRSLNPQDYKISNHMQRIQMLKNRLAQSKNAVGIDRERIIYDTIQEYFDFDRNEKKGFLNDIEKRINECDYSVQKFFQGEDWEPDESQEIDKLRKDKGSLYSQLRFYGIKSGLKINHKENRKVLAKYMRMNKKEFTAEDLDRYYSYKIHRATSAKYHSDNKADHTTILDILEKINDYPEMLKIYKEMGRRDGFIEHEKKEAGSWVTPNMILNYERNRLQMIDKKHLDRIEALNEAETGTDEEKAQVIKEYAELAKRFDKQKVDENFQISLNDIVCAEELRQSVKMAIHDKRILQLKSSEDGLTDEEKIRAYDGNRFKADKNEVELIYSQLEEKIFSNPEAMASELTYYETSEKEHQEELQKKWQQIEINIQERIILLSEQIEQCLKVINNTEDAIKNPECIFENQSKTNEYIKNVLDKTENDIKKVPEIINTTSK